MLEIKPFYISHWVGFPVAFLLQVTAVALAAVVIRRAADRKGRKAGWMAMTFAVLVIAAFVWFAVLPFLALAWG